MSNDKSSYKDLLVWQKAVALSVMLYGKTQHFPTQEQYGLTSQMQRSAVSVASNCEIAHQIGYLSDTDTQSIESEMVEISKMLNGLRNKIKDA